MPETFVLNIQKYCVHDGDGIRTTIFFKGCPLSCRWCHNPESQDYRPQLVFYPKKCNRCSRCAGVCPKGCIAMDALAATNLDACGACGLCAGACVHGAREIAGRPYTAGELVRIAEQDKMFYETSGGGVTLSGGEAMTQDRAFLLELARGIKRRGLNLAVDTCGHTPFEAFEEIAPYVDTFLYDIKIVDGERHRQYTGRDNSLILSNLKKLSDMGARIHIRIPVIGGFNSDDTETDDIIRYLRENIHVEKISLLPYHDIGADRYTRIGLTPPGDGFYTPGDERMSALAEKFRENGFTDVQVGG